jgi:hypothetical protein
VHGLHAGGLDEAATLLDSDAFANCPLDAGWWAAAVEVGAAAVQGFGGVAEAGGEVGHDRLLLS